MKKRMLVTILLEKGWYLARINKHEIWIKGDLIVAIPRSRNIAKYTAETILKTINKIEKGKNAD